MSRRVIRYEGEGKRRRPVYRDEGPASASASSAFAAAGRLSALQIPGTAGEIEIGAGRVERRQMTDDERAVRLEESSRSSPIARVRVTRAEQLAHYHRGGEATRAVRASRRPDPPAPPEEEPAMAIDPAPATAAAFTEKLDRLARRAQTALQAWEALAIADEAARDAKRVWTEADAQLRAALDDVGLQPVPARAAEPAPAPSSPMEPDEDAFETRTVGIDGSRQDDELEDPADDAPEVVTRRPAPAPVAGGGPGPLTKQDRVLAQVVPTRGDLAGIAAAMNTDRGNVNATLHNAGKRGRLTADMIAVLPAAFAKYSPAAG